ncbi:MULTISPECIES: effector-associated constant component EACC1 [unclassified Streptomyces]|uniref:effector-associated constant component EACC1 n=1 Tax=unclassified Streptomyces TaxID=2593676 RepID=UPI002E802364|nr:hypothetical protein [Streptomyces sp. NBC_00589]WTI33606.1 hypothetical protein OIC96_00515 [Streptomyces sp. NBC_00775]WUB32722.1 hypothetical protein OHA51_49220 [Streptomyces sp. NBC_00589]
MKLVDIRLRFIAEEMTAKELVQFQRQLDSEPELRSRVRRIAADDASAGPEGRMGSSMAQLLAVSLGSGGAVSALVAVLPSLLRARRSDTTVEVTLPDGRSAKITAGSAEDARALLESALRDHSSQG